MTAEEEQPYRRSEAFRAMLRRCERQANRRGAPVTICVRLQHVGDAITRASFRVYVSGQVERARHWPLAIIQPTPSRRPPTTPSIESVRRTDATKRAAPWEGVGRRD